jgi:ketosteroid isomerase-like protein
VSTAARSAAERYVDTVNHRDLNRLTSLFRPDAVLDHTLGVHEGREAISAFYRDVIFAAEPVLTATSWSEQGDTCVVSLEGAVGGHVTNTVDVFTVDPDGLIARLEISI